MSKRDRDYTPKTPASKVSKIDAIEQNLSSLSLLDAQEISDTPTQCVLAPSTLKKYDKVSKLVLLNNIGKRSIFEIL
jgi:hypothetical protein